MIIFIKYKSLRGMFIFANKRLISVKKQNK
ncbi:PH domain-containing protein [Clostridium sporogenes]|uniref:PH domain-containing protein n=1 Tax=Clostridium sporogenes TaxID=1509 RepID=A0A6B4UIK4_CLOSG|nr:PH domain-containing protein [Clostridium sp.]MBW5459279.1 hypothetical protein [Clostridium sporogenes]NFD94224.1 PH domain-containing protein [Clostridium sporogenes]NFE46254.1 PH domain-containing protein [Clostridium sporogenes]NFF16474.1 PH domain-containing protein [Clostridium sporogenes]